MTTRAAVLSAALESAFPLFDRFLVGFSDENRVAQPTGIANHAAWTLGHLALYHNRASDRMLGFDEPCSLPSDQFIEGDGTQGTRELFDSESVCYGSAPIADLEMYPVWARCVEIHEQAFERFVRTVRDLDDALFDRPVKWGAVPFAAEQLTTRMLFHLATHTGQLIDLRRGLGLRSVVG